jgi:hypothetical protein
MKLEANVTRFAPNDGYIMDIKKERKAAEEHYEFSFISPGWFLCITESGNAYTISQYMQKIGCACADMRMRCKGKEVCKHLIQFMNLENLPDKDISEEMAQLLQAAGWSGKTLTPPDRPENRKRQKLPNIKDPARKPAPQAAQREKSKEAYKGMTPEQIIKETPQAKLETYARRGAPLAIAELTRRMVEKEAVSA